MDDLQRIVGQAHVQQGQVPPGAADRIEGLGRQAVGQSRQPPRGLLAGLVGIEGLAVRQSEGAQR